MSSGKAKRGKHTSINDPHLRRAVEWIESQPCVEKVLIGVSKNHRHKQRPGTLRGAVVPTPATVVFHGYSGRGSTDVTVILNAPEMRDDFLDRVSERYGP